MKKVSEFFKELEEEKKDKYDEGEYDQEGDMAKSDLRSIIANAQKLHDMIDDADNLPEWVQSKITVAEDYISTVANYMTAEMSEAAKLTPQQKFKNSMKRAGYDMDAGAKRLQDLLTKQKKEREEREKNMKEEAEYLEEKNKPTNPALWSRAVAMARQKFDVYPSAYANGWAAKWYKSKGGSWKSVSESKEDLPFEPDPPKKNKKPDHGPMSRVRHLAKQAMKKQTEKMKPMKETIEESRKAEIVKEIVKKKKNEMNGKFEADPVLTSSVVKENK